MLGVKRYSQMYDTLSYLRYHIPIHADIHRLHNENKFEYALCLVRFGVCLKITVGV